MKAIQMLIVSRLAYTLFVGLFFTVFSCMAVADSEIESSLYGLKNQTELSAFEARSASVTYIDTRSTEKCQQMSIEGGLCMPSDQLISPDGTLANFRDINWLVGTYGVSTETVTIVIGNDKESKYMVAAVLYLLGIKEVAVWESDFAAIASFKKTGVGRTKGILRSEYFTNPMRDELIALDNDLQRVFDSADGVAVEKLAAPGFTGHLIDASSEAPIVTGSTPSAALVNFTDLVLNQNRTVLRVHTNGLSGRSLSDFGYVQMNHSFTIVAAGLVLLSVGVIMFRGKRS